MTDSNETGTQVKDSMLEEMAQAGLLFGRKKSKTNPKMKDYVFANRNGFEMFDLEKTAAKLEEAKAFLASVAKTGKTILFVGTTPAGQEVMKEVAEGFKAPYVTHRWLGGTLSNFETISSRLRYFIKLKADKESGKLEKYTKKERTKFDKELERLERLFGGLEELTAMPAALIVANTDAHSIAVREANIAGVPVIGITNSSTDPEGVDYLIPANDNSISSVRWIVEQLAQALKTK
ncbi:MAG: 30S ribosomal protein S2 [bacterium]|nr:30S ribosomal protein S2 [bacterium]